MMKPGGGRAKGHAWERQVAIMLRPYFPKAKRGLQYQIGFDGSDVIETPFFIECKRGKKVNIRAAFAQAHGDNKTGKPVLIMSKEDNCKPVVSMEWETFEDLIKNSFTMIKLTFPEYVNKEEE